MTNADATERIAVQPSMWDSVREGMQPFAGRWNLVMRYVIASLVVIVLSMSLRLPMLGTSLFVVFMATQSNVVLVNQMSKLGIVLVSLTVGFVLVILMFTYEHPSIRIAASFAMIFLCAFLMYASKLGMVFFIVGIALVAIQQSFDSIPNAELMTRACLWVWMACVYPVVICAIINSFLAPIEPRAQLKKQARAQLTQIQNMLSARPTQVSALRSYATLNGFSSLQALLRFSSMRDPSLLLHRSLHRDYLNTVALLHIRATKLMAQNASQVCTVNEQDLHALSQAIEQLDRSIQTETAFVLNTAQIPRTHLQNNSTLADIWQGLERLSALSLAPDTDAPPQKAATQLLQPDAGSNPVYTEFAFKTTLAVLLSYLVVRGADWGGIQTMALTALIVAQPSAGASTAKILQRFAGALIGAGYTLVATIFFVPQVDSIVGLLLICLPILVLAAYIAAGPPQVNYVGTQMAFTFALTMMGGFWASTDLVGVRDRTIGIALGIGLAFFIQTSLWPYSEVSLLQQTQRRLAKGLAQLLGGTGASDSSELPDAAMSVSEGLTNLADIESILDRMALEPTWNSEGDAHDIHGEQTLAIQLADVLSQVDAYRIHFDRVHEQLSDAQQAALRKLQAHVADALLTANKQSQPAPPTDRSQPPESAYAQLAGRLAAMSSTVRNLSLTCEQTFLNPGKT